MEGPRPFRPLVRGPVRWAGPDQIGDMPPSISEYSPSLLASIGGADAERGANRRAQRPTVGHQAVAGQTGIELGDRPLPAEIGWAVLGPAIRRFEGTCFRW